MKEAIGDVAGEIWRFLDRQSESVNTSTLKDGLSCSSTLLMMGLGWLAREDKLAIETPGNSNTYRIRLSIILTEIGIRRETDLIDGAWTIARHESFGTRWLRVAAAKV